jgi:hypothetical protein
MGSCLVEGESSQLCRDCGVFDFSAYGAGMDFRYPDPFDLVGRRISVSLPIGGSMDVALTGEVRNAKAGPDGIVRAGIEFVDLSGTERVIVDVLEQHSACWPRV